LGAHDFFRSSWRARGRIRASGLPRRALRWMGLVIPFSRHCSTSARPKTDSASTTIPVRRSSRGGVISAGAYDVCAVRRGADGARRGGSNGRS
jgi:hypothetical protein